MARYHWTKEQKAEFWKAFTAHREEGCNIREAYRLACADLKALGKDVPGLRTFGNWYRKAMRPQKEDEDQVDTVDNAEPEEAVDTEAEAAEKAAPDPETDADDYTRRLELMCRLYRSRSEYNVDSLCDYLLPDLCAEEE